MKRTNRTRRIWRASVGIIVLALAVVTIWRLWPRERLLLDVAHSVVKVDEKTQEVCWLSNSQLLMISTDPFTPGSNGWRGSVDFFDTRSQTRTHLTALTQLLIRTSVSPLDDPRDFEVSADGVWLLWRNYGPRAEWWSPRVAKMDGTHYREWEGNQYDESAFLDSHHLLLVRRNEPILTVPDLLDPSHDRNSLQNDLFAPDATRSALFLTVKSVNQDSTQGCARIDAYPVQDWANLLYANDGNGRYAPNPTQTRQIKFTQGASLHSAFVSRQQQAICYDLLISRSQPLLVWLNRILPQFAPKPTPQEALWISRADGRDLQEVGSIKIGPNANVDSLKDLQWLPDGKRINFVYHGTLYVVPAEPGK